MDKKSSAEGIPMRSVLLVLGLLFATAASAQDVAKRGGQLAVFPFHCKATQGVPILRQGAPHFYDFRGSVERRQVAVCDPANRRNCQDFLAYNYDIMCDGGVVTAAQLAAATYKSDDYPLELRGNTLYAIFTQNREVPSGHTMGIPGQGLQFEIPSFQYQKVVTGTVPLPVGMGPAPAPDLTPLKITASIPTVGVRNPKIPEPTELSILESLFAFVFPWLKLALIGIVLAAGVCAAASYRAMPGSRIDRFPFTFVAFMCALVALINMKAPILSSDDARTVIAERQHAHTSVLKLIEHDEAEIETIVSQRNGRFEPIAAKDMPHLQRLLTPRSLPSVHLPENSFSNPQFLAPLVGSLVVLLLYAMRTLAGVHYLLVRHPAAAVAQPALRSGSLFDNRKLADALDPDFTQFERPSPSYVNANQVRRAHALREKIEADGELADAAMRRDRARAALAAAQADLKRAKGNRSWWHA